MGWSSRDNPPPISERDGYGVPCWVASVHPEPEEAVGFYTDLFGWEATDVMPPGSSGRYFMCKLRGRDVAAIGSQRGEGAPMAVWGTHVWVESADDTVAEVTGAGGTVVRRAVRPPGRRTHGRFADSGGAVFSVWQPGEHRGAKLVNEPGAWSMGVLNARAPAGARRSTARCSGALPTAST